MSIECHFYYWIRELINQADSLINIIAYIHVYSFLKLYIYSIKKDNTYQFI